MSTENVEKLAGVQTPAETKARKKYPQEVIAAVAENMGISGQTVRNWAAKERDSGKKRAVASPTPKSARQPEPVDATTDTNKEVAELKAKIGQLDRELTAAHITIKSMSRRG